VIEWGGGRACAFIAIVLCQCIGGEEGGYEGYSGKHNVLELPENSN